MASFDEEEEKSLFNESFGEENTLPPLTRGEVIIDNEKLLIEEKTHIMNEINIQEDNINLQNLQDLINKGVKEGTEQVISMLNKDISESNDKLDEIIKETKKKTSKPLSMNKLPKINPFNTDGMTEPAFLLRAKVL